MQANVMCPLCRRPVVPTIRLGSIARKLPFDMRQTVADAVAYDAPPSDDSSAIRACVAEPLRPLNHQSSQQSSQQPSQQPKQQSGQQSSQQSSHMHTQLGTESLPQHPSSASQRHQSMRHISTRPLPLPGHLDLDESDISHPWHTWQDVSMMTPRQLALEQLLGHKLQGLPGQHASPRSQLADTSKRAAPQSPQPADAGQHDAAVQGTAASTSRLQVGSSFIYVTAAFSKLCMRIRQ